MASRLTLEPTLGGADPGFPVPRQTKFLPLCPALPTWQWCKENTAMNGSGYDL